MAHIVVMEISAISISISTSSNEEGVKATEDLPDAANNIFQIS
jgi:hypothetical protein